MHADTFGSMTELVGALAAGENYSLQIDTSYHSAVKIFAPHAGCIEPCTGPVALALAEGHFDLFAFHGTRKKDCFDTLHVTSARYDLPECVRLASEGELAVSIHGCAGKESFLEIGGGAADLAAELTELLVRNGFDARVPPLSRRGEDPGNFINKAKRGGIQIEMSEGIRRSLFPSYPRPLSRNPQLFASFIDCTRNWLLKQGELLATDEARRKSDA
jgi:phage replication-related protein YjqB (UPF0714/DUF867 family)